MMMRLRNSNIALSRSKEDAEAAKDQMTKKGRSLFFTANNSPSLRIWLAHAQIFSPAARLNSDMIGSHGFQCTPTTELDGQQMLRHFERYVTTSNFQVGKEAQSRLVSRKSVSEGTQLVELDRRINSLSAPAIVVQRIAPSVACRSLLRDTTLSACRFPLYQANKLCNKELYAKHLSHKFDFKLVIHSRKRHQSRFINYNSLHKLFR